MQYEKATLLARTKDVRSDGAIVEVVIWQLSERLPGSLHSYKYRLYFGATGQSRVRYDNERGKGDHRHIGDREEAYRFTTIDQLLDDFERDISNWSTP